MANIEHLQIVNVEPSRIYEVLTTKKGLSEVWTNELTMGENAVGAVHEFRFGDDDISRMAVEELIPNRKVAWRCMESDPEWVDTEIVFHIEEKNGKSYVTLQHMQWREVTEFYRFCNYHWAMFLLSLKKYCEDGQGSPYKSRNS